MTNDFGERDVAITMAMDGERHAARMLESTIRCNGDVDRWAKRVAELRGELITLLMAESRELALLLADRNQDTEDACTTT